MAIKIAILSSFLMLLLIASVGSAAEITRTVSPEVVMPGGTVTVTLDVDTAGGAPYYGIDEIYPEGFVITDPGIGKIEHMGHWKYVVITDAVDTQYTYVMTAPSQEGVYQFSGEYIFGNMDETVPIGGTSALTVSQAATDNSVWDFAIAVIVLVAILIIYIATKRRSR